MTTIRERASGNLKKWLGVCALLLIPFSSGAWADTTASVSQPGDILDLPIEELRTIQVATVTGASSYQQKVTEAPSSISIITADDIRKFGYRTLADILRSIRGFYISYDRNYSYAGVRGFNRPGDYNSRLLLLVDGHRINENVYDSAEIGTEFMLDVDLIDRVEIVRGPGSSLYGSNAFFGVINIITRTGRDVNGAEVSTSAASFDTYYGRATYGMENPNGLKVLLSASSYGSKGTQNLYYPEFDTPSNNNGIAHNEDGDRFKSMFSKISFQDFTLEGAYGYRVKDIPTASFMTVFNDSADNTTDEHSYLDLSYRHTYGHESSVMARIYYDAYNFIENYAYNYPPLTLNRDTVKGRWWGGELRHTGIFLENHKVTAGAEYQDNIHQDQTNFDLAPYYVYEDLKKNSHLWALYVQDEYRMLDTVLFNIGIRHDDYSTFGGETNPRLALIYSPLDKTTFKLLYGSAFRAPNVYEFYYDDGVTQKANPDLKPEKITTYELIYEQYLASHIRSSVSAFSYRINDLITQTTDPVDGLLQYKNINRVDAKGGELELEGVWSNGIRGRISYTFEEATDASTGELLTNSPKQLAKMNVIFPILEEWLFVDPEVQYTSKRKTISGNYADDFVIANLTVFGRELVKGLDASVSVYNLFDKKYGDPTAGPPQQVQDVIVQDGRNYRAKLTYRF
jgi:outer membrane receptor for ferrienterochelin and colicins